MIACRAHGFTLIEVLVALLVLAIAMVGVMASQLAAQRTRQGTALMSSAAQLAAGVADRMRANGGARDLYVGLDYDATRDGAPEPITGACFLSSCTPAELAAFDLAELRHRLHQSFPGGRIVICRDAPAAAEGARTAWECGGGASAPIAVKIGWLERTAAPVRNAAPAMAILVDGGMP